MIHHPWIFLPGPGETSNRTSCILSSICSQWKPWFSLRHTDSLSFVQHLSKQNHRLPIWSRRKPKIRLWFFLPRTFHCRALEFYSHTSSGLLPPLSLSFALAQVPVISQLDSCPSLLTGLPAALSPSLCFLHTGILSRNIWPCWVWGNWHLIHCWWGCQLIQISWRKIYQNL